MESEKGMSVEDYGEIMPGFNGILIVDDDATMIEKCKCMWYEGE